MPAESRAATGRVKIQARAMLRIVESWRPLPLAIMVPATPEERTWVVETGMWRLVGAEDGEGGSDFGGRALSVGEVLLADFLADGDDDAFPADHGAEAEGDGDGDLNPGGDKLRRVVELLFVGGRGICSQRR